MKIVKIIMILLSVAALLFSLTACSKDGIKLNIDQPKSISTDDEAAQEEQETIAIENSDNVNGKRFSFTLNEFTERYNAAKRLIGDTDLIIAGNWRAQGEPQSDNNGVKIRYYYYDDYNVNITASVEVESGKLMNVGIGTTMSHFMTQESGENNSDEVLKKAALMADAACCLGEEEIDNLQDVFYQITTGADDMMWYKGFVFSLSTQEDKNDRKNSIMLYRVFPVTDTLKENWKLNEYKPK